MKDKQETLPGTAQQLRDYGMAAWWGVLVSESTANAALIVAALTPEAAAEKALWKAQRKARERTAVRMVMARAGEEEKSG